MARPNKIGLDYFSFDCDFFNDPKIKILQAKYGPDGLTLYIKILTEIYSQYGYYFPVNEDSILLIAGELNLPFDKVNEIIEFQVSKNLFSDVLYNSQQILTSVRIQRQYLSGTEKRSSISLQHEYLLIDPIKEKSNSHRAEILLNGLGMPKHEFRDTITSIKDGNYNQIESESEIESEIEIESESEIEMSQKSFLKNEVDFVKNLFNSYTKIHDPNYDLWIEPVLKEAHKVREGMTLDQNFEVIKEHFKLLKGKDKLNSGYLIDSIQSKITTKHQEILSIAKQRALKEAERLKREELERAKAEEESKRDEQLEKIQRFYDEFGNEMTDSEKVKLSKCLVENRFLSATPIVDSVKERLGMPVNEV